MRTLMIDNFTKDGKCSGCGNCCSGILPLSKAEIKRIHEYMKTHEIKEHHSGVAMMTGKVDGTCPFRDEVNRKCDIYEIRPEICRCFVCNKAEKDVLRDRNRLHACNKTVFVRSEFFGNDELKIFIENVGKKNVLRIL